jgi:membrane protein
LTAVVDASQSKTKAISAVLRCPFSACSGKTRRTEGFKHEKPPPKVRPSHRKARLAWFEIVRLLYSAIGEHRVVSIAAGVTFFSLLAIFPAIAALVSIYGLFADPANIQAQLSSLSSLLPGGAVEVISDQLQRVASGGRTRQGNIRSR